MASSGLRPKKTGVGSAAGTARPAAWSRATSATLGAQVSSGLGTGAHGPQGVAAATGQPTSAVYFFAPKPILLDTLLPKGNDHLPSLHLTCKD